MTRDDHLEMMVQEIVELRDALADEERVVELSAAILRALRYRVERLAVRCTALAAAAGK